MAEEKPTCNICDESNKLKRCGRCHKIFYCSRDHQIKDWPSHKLSCSKELEIGTNHRTQSDILTVGLQKETVGKESSSENASSLYHEYDKRRLHFKDFEKPDDFYPLLLSEFAIKHLRKGGFCVIDGILSEETCSNLKDEVMRMKENGLLCTGKLEGGKTSGEEDEKTVNIDIRNDENAWIEGSEEYPHICHLVENTMDIIAAGLNVYSNNEFCVQGKTKAMVACYPGNGAGYKRHIDNPTGDGRLITCIMYLNENWDCEKNGGNLRVFPASMENDDCNYIDISPKMNRLLMFWSDKRTPHEVQPSNTCRYAITVWYFDKEERELAKKTADTEKRTADINAEMMLLDIKKKETEKKLLEQQIQNEAMKALKVLSEEEMEAFCVLAKEHDNPREALQQMGITGAVLDVLLQELNRRLGKN